MRFVAVAMTQVLVLLGCGDPQSETLATGGGPEGGSGQARSGGATGGGGSSAPFGSTSTGEGTGPGGGPTTACPNMPAGARVLMETGFDTPDGEGQLWEVYPGAGQVLPLQDAPHSAPNVDASILPAGQSVGGQQTIWPKAEAAEPLKNLYLCMQWKMNADFVGLQTNNKLVFLGAQDFTFGHASTNGLLSVPKRGAAYPNPHFQMTFGHNTGNLDNSHTCSADLGLVCYPNENDTDLVPDHWYTVEARVVASTCNTCRDGTVEWWIDDVLQGRYEDLNYGEGVVNEWQINHTWDGAQDKQCGPPTNPQNAIGRDCTADQAHYFDNVVLATSP